MISSFRKKCQIAKLNLGSSTHNEMSQIINNRTETKRPKQG